MTRSPSPLVIANLLLAARERVKQGWCQRTDDDGNGNVCLAGAIYEVQGAYSNLYYPAMDAVDKQVLRMVGGDRAIYGTYRPSMGFNDIPGRTKEEVMDLLTTTATAVSLGEIEV